MNSSPLLRTVIWRFHQGQWKFGAIGAFRKYERYRKYTEKSGKGASAKCLLFQFHNFFPFLTLSKLSTNKVFHLYKQLVTLHCAETTRPMTINRAFDHSYEQVHKDTILSSGISSTSDTKVERARNLSIYSIKSFSLLK